MHNITGASKCNARGDGHFLNCLVYAFFNALSLCSTKCLYLPLCVCLRSCVCVCVFCAMSRYFFYLRLLSYCRTGKFETFDRISQQLRVELIQAVLPVVFTRNHKTDTANVLTAFCHMCQCSHGDESRTKNTSAFANEWAHAPARPPATAAQATGRTDGRSSACLFDMDRLWKVFQKVFRMPKWVSEWVHVLSREISCELNCSTLYSVIWVK